LLDHDLMFVQVDEIHLIHLINILHIVFQNQDYNDQIQAKIMKQNVKERNKYLFTCRRENFVGSRSNVCSG
jgi:hypothetical protein